MIINFFRIYQPFPEITELYESYQKYNISGNNLSLDELISRNEFYQVYTDGEFGGCLYVHNETDKYCYISGFARRHINTTQSIIEFCEFLKPRFRVIYSQTPYKHAVYCLFKAGFKHLKDNIYVKENK